MDTNQGVEIVGTLQSIESPRLGIRVPQHLEDQYWQLVFLLVQKNLTNDEIQNALEAGVFSIAYAWGKDYGEMAYQMLSGVQYAANNNLGGVSIEKS